MKRRGTTAYRALLLGNPGDVPLVTVGGVPVYGDRALLQRLLPTGPLEAIEICGEPRALHVVDDAASDHPLGNRCELLGNTSPCDSLA